MNHNENNNGNISFQFLNNQLQNNEQPMNYSDNGITNHKNKFILVMMLILIAILGTVAFFYFKKDKKTNNDFDIKYSTSFFLKDSNGKYALFHDDGKKLTDSIFTSVGDFVNGTAFVKKENSYGIINENGKMNVDFGKYTYITDSAGMYEVYGEDHYHYLINGKGKILYDLKNMHIRTFIGVDTYSILEDENSKTYKVLDSDGHAMLTLPMNERLSDDPSTNDEDGYISIFYNNKNYILNSVTGKKIISFDSNLHYCVNKVMEDGKIITMNSCVSWSQTQDKVYYKVFKDGKLYDLTNQCEEVYYHYDTLVCDNDNTKYLLDSNLNIGIPMAGKAYVDNNTYAMPIDGAFKGIDFYKNGNLVKHVDCRRIEETGHMKNGLYVLKKYGGGTCGGTSDVYEYYNSNGENAFGKSYIRADKFDENGFAKVSDDKKNYYLIDTNGKKVGQDYTGIALYSGYYIVSKDGLKGILDAKGNVIVDRLYSRIEITGTQRQKYAILTTSDSKYIVYDLEKKSESITLDSSPSLDTHYISTSKNGKNQYYTYTGKMFYETN